MSNVAIQIWGEWDIGFGDIGFDHLGMLCGWSRKKFHPSWVWERGQSFWTFAICRQVAKFIFWF
jgi:hypothetical protein